MISIADALKELPPPPLRVNKTQANDFGVQSLNASASDSPELSVRPSQESSMSRSSSSRFRRHVAALTRSNKPADISGREDGYTSATSDDSSTKTWQPRWTSKPRKSLVDTAPSREPVSSPPLPPIPTLAGAISPPPAVKLDDAAFGRPMSTTGLLDLNLDPSRFSFLDMSNKDLDSADEVSCTEPIDRHPSSLPSSYPHASPPRVAEIILQPPTPSSPQAVKNRFLQDPSHNASRYSQGAQSLPTSSPALASLISSFPAPSTREKETSSSSSSLLEEEGDHIETLSDAGNSWDGGETWEVNTSPLSEPEMGQTSLPYLDMADNTAEEEQILKSLPQHSFPQEQKRPFWPAPTRNLPPRPAPTAALPALPHRSLHFEDRASTDDSPCFRSSDSTEPSLNRNGLKRLTLESFPPSASADGKRASRQVQRPLLLPSLASSSSLDRLTPSSANVRHPVAVSSAARSASPASFVTASQTGSPTNSVILDSNASPGELAKSLDIPRDAIKQMLETTQHVWRSHNVGPMAGIGSTSAAFLPRSRSFPVLSSLYASDGENDVDTSESHASHRSAEKRLSISNVPYISSNSPSLDHQQSPGWANSKSSPDAVRGPILSKADKIRFRQTFLRNADQEAETISPNFSRPINRGLMGGDLMSISASMPALSSLTSENKTQTLLQSPLLLKNASGNHLAFTNEEEQEILVDSGSESHHSSYNPATEVGSRFKEAFDDSDIAPLRSVMNASPQAQVKNRTLDLPSGRMLARRNSDTVLNESAPEFGSRTPGELHAWSVSVDDKGVPAIRPSPSAFHRPKCTLAGKTNATWQCGCRGFDDGDIVATSISNVPHFGVRALTDQHSPGRNRSLSAGNIPDPRQAKLWNQVELNKVLIRKHEEEIAGLQQQVIRISSEIASARPSLSSAFNTPEPPQSARFAAAQPADVNVDKLFPEAPTSGTGKELPGTSLMSVAKSIPSAPRPSVPVHHSNSSVSRLSHTEDRTKGSSMKSSNSVRERLASLSRMQLMDRDDVSRSTKSLDLGHTRFASSSSTGRLNKKLRSLWSSSSNNKENFSESISNPIVKLDDVAIRRSKTLGASKPLPKLQFDKAAKESRPLPAVPMQEGGSKDKKYPPSSRKYNYDNLPGAGAQTSIGANHLRGRSESSSFGTSTSIFSSEGGEGYESRYGFFPKMNKRWDSISSRGTNASARSSADLVATQAGGSHKPAMASSTSTPAMLTASRFVDMRPVHPSLDLPRRSKTPPPRRSSLRKSSDMAPVRSPIPAAFMPSPSTGMDPITEQSEIGSPSSVRHGPTRDDVEMSPVSIVNASISGQGRMSMSDRYNSQGLTVPISLPLSSSQVSLASSPHLSPISPLSSHFGGPDTSRSLDASPRLHKQPLQMGMSHGSLTISRQQPMTS